MDLVESELRPRAGSITAAAKRLQEWVDADGGLSDADDSEGEQTLTR